MQRPATPLPTAQIGSTSSSFVMSRVSFSSIELKRASYSSSHGRQPPSGRAPCPWRDRPPIRCHSADTIRHNQPLEEEHTYALVGQGAALDTHANPREPWTSWIASGVDSRAMLSLIQALAALSSHMYCGAPPCGVAMSARMPARLIELYISMRHRADTLPDIYMLCVSKPAASSASSSQYDE